MPFTKISNLILKEEVIHWDANADGRPKFFKEDIAEITQEANSYLIYNATYREQNRTDIECLALIGYNSITGEIFNRDEDIAVLGCPPYDRPGLIPV